MARATNGCRLPQPQAKPPAMARTQFVSIALLLMLTACSTEGDRATTGPDAILKYDRDHLSGIWGAAAKAERREDAAFNSCMATAGFPENTVSSQLTSGGGRIDLPSRYDRATRDRITSTVSKQLPSLRRAILKKRAERKPSASAPRETVNSKYTRVAFGDGRERTYPYPGGGTISIPTGGCSGQAIRDTYDMPVNQFLDLKASIPREDSLVTTAVKINDSSVMKYGTCMKSKGFDQATSPVDVFDGLNSDIDSFMNGNSPLSKIEIQEGELLRSDAECRRTTRVSQRIDNSIDEIYSDWKRESGNDGDRFLKIVNSTRHVGGS